MALTYLGVTAFAQSGPEQWRLGQFELDQMSVPFSGAATGLTTYVSSLTRGSAWSGDAAMFLTGWSVSDANKQYPSVTQEYIGAKGGVLPDVKQDYDEQVQSASSSIDSNGATYTAPITVQYYAPSSIYTWFTTTAPGDPGSVTAADPIGEPRGITITTSDTTFALTTVFQEIMDRFFVTQTVDSFSSTERVTGGKYYQNTIRRTKFLSPWIFSVGAGSYFVLTNPGAHYTTGDILTISGIFGAGTIQVTNVGLANSITDWTQLSNTFIHNESNLVASGGSGLSAVFTAVVVL